MLSNELKETLDIAMHDGLAPLKASVRRKNGVIELGVRLGPGNWLSYTGVDEQDLERLEYHRLIQLQEELHFLDSGDVLEFKDEVVVGPLETIPNATRTKLDFASNEYFGLNREDASEVEDPLWYLSFASIEHLILNGIVVHHPKAD